MSRHQRLQRTGQHPQRRARKWRTRASRQVRGMLRGQPFTEGEARSTLERLAAEQNNGADRAPIARALAHAALRREQFTAAWQDACAAIRNRDDVAPPAVRDWRDVLSDDAAASQEDAHQILAGRAVQALTVLRTGRLAWGWVA